MRHTIDKPTSSKSERSILTIRITTCTRIYEQYTSNRERERTEQRGIQSSRAVRAAGTVCCATGSLTLSRGLFPARGYNTRWPREESAQARGRSFFEKIRARPLSLSRDSRTDARVYWIGVNLAG